MIDYTYECRISVRPEHSGAAVMVRAMLNLLGVSEQDIAEHSAERESRISVYYHALVKAEQCMGKLRALKLKGVRVSCRTLHDSDWKSRWKKYVRPFAITPDIRVVPQWKRHTLKRTSPGDIFIDTTLAFGTGLHATTRMMAQFLVLTRGTFGSVLDVGTGSGILSIIACRYGAQVVYAIDMDKESVNTARCNFQANGCVPRYLGVRRLEDLRVKRCFDLVCANLLTEDLVRCKKKLFSLVRQGHYLAVSGVHKDNYSLFRKRFISKGFSCARVLEREGWKAVLFRRKVKHAVKGKKC